MAAICAQRTAGVDVNLPFQIAALDASIGRIARLRGSPREGPESGRKPSFRCVCEIAFTALLRRSLFVR